MSAAERISVCRACGAPEIRPVLSLGDTPIANALVDPSRAAHDDPVFPLEIVVCERCSLVQLGFILPASLIFDEDYPYFSSFSDALGRHAAAHVAQLITDRDLGDHSFVVEVASNDGYLLRNFVSAGVRVVGIDPAPGPAATANSIGVPTIVEFFGRDVAARVLAEHGPADVIIANNVMAHVPDLDDFVGGMAMLLAEEGVITVENPSVVDMIDHVEFDTIYHEHYSYFSCSSVEALMATHGLFLNDVEYFPDLHGGTLRWFVGKRTDRTARCGARLDAERAAGVTTSSYYDGFAERVRACQEALREMLEQLRASGRRVAAYGAAAKGATLLNSTGIGTDLIDYVVDRNVHKQGKLMPGCRLPIRPVEFLIDDRPDDLLLLSWNFATEIVDQQSEFIDGGGHVHVPVPAPHRIR
jgi:SAM-dependent methyltransferase